MPTYYLNADTGNDSTGDGSSGSPWLTIAKAHTAASSGDTIICQDSTANYTFTNQIFSKSLTIQGQQIDASGAVFSGGGANVAWMLTNGYSYTFEKVTFKNAATINGNLFRYSGASSINVAFSNCVFRDLNLGAQFYVFLIGNAGVVGGAVVFSACVFIDIVRTAAYGLLSVGDFGAGTQTSAMHDCVIYFNSGLSTSGNSVFDGVWTITNCIIKNDSGVSMAIMQTGIPVATYNCFNGFTSTPSGTGNITDDPLFIDAANGNFNLRPDSPAIGAGS